jgi:hypothetical protein
MLSVKNFAVAMDYYANGLGFSKRFGDIQPYTGNEREKP